MGVCGQHQVSTALPMERTPILIEYEASWDPEPVTENVCRRVFRLGMFWTFFSVSYWLQEYKID